MCCVALNVIKIHASILAAVPLYAAHCAYAKYEILKSDMVQ